MSCKKFLYFNFNRHYGLDPQPPNIFRLCVLFAPLRLKMDKVNYKKIILIQVVLFFVATLSAQRPVKICGEYTYHAPENVSLEQARRIALERAKTQALAEKFGTTIMQSNVTVIETENEEADVWFRMIGGSEVKGEWLEDTKTPEYNIFYDAGMLIVKVSVCGNARELKGAGIDFQAKVLKNGTETKFESNEFKDGDVMYLWFKSPVAGYLAVYLVDETLTVNCLLPYRRDQTGKVKIESGKEYIFFSKKHADQTKEAIVDEYHLTSKKQAEHDLLYIIFSPNEFTKANDTQPHGNLPRQLSFEDFQKWLARNKQRDKDMTDIAKTLTVRKRTVHGAARYTGHGTRFTVQENPKGMKLL